MLMIKIVISLLALFGFLAVGLAASYVLFYGLMNIDMKDENKLSGRLDSMSPQQPEPCPRSFEPERRWSRMLSSQSFLHFTLKEKKLCVTGYDCRAQATIDAMAVRSLYIGIPLGILTWIGIFLLIRSVIHISGQV